MPVIKVGDEVFGLLIEESRKLELSTRALADYIVLKYFGELEEEEEDVDVDEDEDEDEEEEDVEGPDVIGELLGGLDVDEDE